MRCFRELKVWDKAHKLTLALYETTQMFPKQEMFGLTSQIRRAAASIGANLAEGAGKTSPADFARFVEIAFGSAGELEYHLLLAHDLGYIPEATQQGLAAELVEVKRMLTGLMQQLRKAAQDVHRRLRADG